MELSSDGKDKGPVKQKELGQTLGAGRGKRQKNNSQETRRRVLERTQNVRLQERWPVEEQEKRVKVWEVR